MHSDQQDKINKEVIRRVLAHDESIQLEQGAELRRQATIESLQSMTSLPEAEIRRIAEEVRARYAQSTTQTPLGRRGLRLKVIVALLLLAAFVVFYGRLSELLTPSAQRPTSTSPVVVVPERQQTPAAPLPGGPKEPAVAAMAGWYSICTDSFYLRK